MKRFSLPFRNINNFVRDRRGSIAPVAALLVTGSILVGGLGVDLSRQVELRNGLQDAADSAALAGAAQTDEASAIASATAYVAAARSRLPDQPYINATYTYDATTNASAPTMTVKLSATIPSTILSVVKPTLSSTVTSEASGTLMRNVTISVTNFNSSASDLNQIYYYTYDPTLTGANLFQYTPSSLPSSNLILSNNPKQKLTGSTSFGVPVGDSVAFALSNTTGGISGYGSNCYGQTQGSTMIYYSTREYDGSYYDYGSAGFTACQDTSDTQDSANTEDPQNVFQVLSTCTPTSQTTYVNGHRTTTTNGEYGTVTPGSACWETGSSGRHGATTKVPAGNYIYTSGYGRNPLRYSTSNTNCTKGDVGYEWDDNGGGTDDNDFNDAVFTVNCTQLVVANQTIKLVN